MYSHKSDATDFIPYNASTTIGVKFVLLDRLQASDADTLGHISFVTMSDTESKIKKNSINKN